MKYSFLALFCVLPVSLSVVPVSAAAADAPPAFALAGGRSALVVTDPQNDFLDPKGVAYGLFAENLKELNAIENMERLFKSAKSAGMPVFVSPHSNDLVLQLRSRGVDTVVLAGLAANLCTDSHLRELVENGFKVVVVKDAVGAPGADAYKAAVINYGFIANAVWTTDDAVKAMARY